MPLDTKTLCQYRLERAKEDLLTAENNHQAVSIKQQSTARITQFFTVYVQ